MRKCPWYSIANDDQKQIVVNFAKSSDSNLDAILAFGCDMYRKGWVDILISVGIGAGFCTTVFGVGKLLEKRKEKKNHEESK